MSMKDNFTSKIPGRLIKELVLLDNFKKSDIWIVSCLKSTVLTLLNLSGLVDLMTSNSGVSIQSGHAQGHIALSGHTSKIATQDFKHKQETLHGLCMMILPEF